jgi:PAS domain S-box-containing protein
MSQFNNIPVSVLQAIAKHNTKQWACFIYPDSGLPSLLAAGSPNSLDNLETPTNQINKLISEGWRKQSFETSDALFILFTGFEEKSEEIPLEAFDNSKNAIAFINSTGEILRFNKSFSSLFHLTKSSETYSLIQLVDEHFKISLQEMLNRIHENKPLEIQVKLHESLGEKRFVQIEFLPNPGTFNWLCTAKDVSKEENERRFDALMERLAEVLENAGDFRNNIDQFFSLVCKETGFEIGECWLPDYLNRKEKFFTGYYPEDKDCRKFRDFSSTLEFILEENFETAKGEPKIENVFLNEQFPRRKMLEECGLNRGYSLPIKLGKKKIATLFFFGKDGQIDELFGIRLMRALSNRLGAYIESRRISYESEQIFELVPDFLCILSQSGKFHKVNQRLAELLGKSAEELTGISFFDCVDDEYTEVSLNAFQQLQNNPVVHFEAVMNGAENKRYWLEWSASLGKQDGIVYAAGQDLTLRVLYDEELRTQNEKFMLLRQAAQDAIYEWNVLDGKIDWGDSLHRVFGHALHSGDTIEAWEKFLHPSDRDRVMNNLHSAMLQRDRLWSDEYQFQCVDGSYKFVLDRGIFLYDSKGNAIRQIGLMQDITALKQSEESLLQLNNALQERARQLLGFNKELEQFAYIVSHDLQEPLRMISSFMKLLLNSKEVTMTEKSEQYINFAIDGADRMKRLIQDLLTYSRIGTTEEDFTELNIRDIIKDSLLIYQQLIREKNIQVNVDQFPPVKGIRSLIQQILDNLISNAIKYNDKPTPSIQIKYSDQGDFHCISVIDNGIGIDARHFDTIYVPFKRLHQRNEYSGTGIGLAICKKIVEKHQGKIWVESQTGVGSQFHFTLPKQHHGKDE